MADSPKLTDFKPVPLDLAKPPAYVPFDVNEGISPDPSKGGPDTWPCRLPSMNPDGSIRDYAATFTELAKANGSTLNLLEIFAKAGGATSLPPSVQSFANISYMPNAATSQLGILQWPGLPPETLEKLAREHVGIQMIVGLRVDEVIQYSQLSSQPWRPGWHIIPDVPKETISRADWKKIREAEQFLLNGGDTYFSDPFKRDAAYRMGFTQFLAAIARDSLVYDQIAIWTDREKDNKLKSFAPMPAQNIRLLARPDKSRNIVVDSLDFMGRTFESAANVDSQEMKSYDPHKVFCVAVDETGNVVQKFNRYDLVFYRRNVRNNASVGGYGYPEIEMALSLITGLTNAINFNSDLFNKNSVPKAILLLKGNFSQRQLDALGRLWDNLQRGMRTDWTLPALQVTEKGQIEVLSLEKLRDQPAYYNNLINLFIGALVTVYRFPAHKLGYKVSGTERDSRPDETKEALLDEDVGRTALFTHLENIINTYILSSRWEGIKFEFTNKSPKEDARYYEARKNAMTWGEHRISVELPPVVDLAKTPEEKFIAGLMDMAPVDPNLTGIFQSILAAMVKGGMMGVGDGADKKDPELPGGRTTSKKDPAQSELHGHLSGVRRNSRQEKNKDSAPPDLSAPPLTAGTSMVDRT